ncbi:MAG: GAF domain-containing protein [Gemmatimonadaceae bacterium]
MPPRTLASLAHALGIAADLDAAVLALGESLQEIDRAAQTALFRFDGRRGMLRERLRPEGPGVERLAIDTTFDHLPSRERAGLTGGTVPVDFAARSDDIARLLRLEVPADGGWLTAWGLRFDNALGAVLVVYEPRRFFGTRTAERFAPSVALFDLAFSRLLEREARIEAVGALEQVTQRLHDEHQRKLLDLQQQLQREVGAARSAGPMDRSTREVELQREIDAAQETARRATRQSQAVESQVAAAVEQLEKTHIELHRRTEALRQKTRTLYLIERVLALAASTDEPRQLADGLLNLVGDDMQAQRCSLFLRAPEAGQLFLAAAKGNPPHVTEGARTTIGEGITGRVAASREPLLVQELEQATAHRLRRDEYFTSGSFISFPLVFHGNLVGVVNITNRVQAGVFVEEDVERVRLLALVTALVATSARLPERLLETLGVC